MAKIRITGDGTPAGTFIYVGDERLEGVQSVRFTAGVHEKAMLVLEVKRPELDLDLDEMGTVLCMDHKPVQHRDGKPPWCRNCGQP